MSDNRLATARMRVRIAARDLAVAETRPLRGEDRSERVAKATQVLDDAVLAAAALLNGGAS